MKYVDKIIALLVLLLTLEYTSINGQQITFLTEVDCYKLNQSLINPENIQLLPYLSIYGLLRFDHSFKLPAGHFNADIKWLSELSAISDMENHRNKARFCSVLDPIELYYQLSKGPFGLLAGRKKVKMGVGYIVSPSDIIIQPPSLTDPTDRFYNIKGSDLLQLSYYTKSGQVDFYYLIDTRQNTRFYFRDNSVALRYYHSFSPFELSAAVRWGFDGRLQVAANGTVAIGERLELHTDNMIQARNEMLYPSPIGMFRSKQGPVFRLLFGGQWSPVKKVNIIFEWVHLSDGYSNREWDDLMQMAAIYQRLLNMPVIGISGLWKYVLRSVYPYRDRISKKNYLFIRLFKTDLLKKVDGGVITYLGLDDMASFNQLALNYRPEAKTSIYLHLELVPPKSKSSFEMYDFSQTIRLGIKTKF